jgi:UDP-N-acetyl-D-mannosaminuronate dehydrogenase
MTSRGIHTISVVGLGYVGLPIAVAFGKHVEVVGYDIELVEAPSEEGYDAVVVAVNHDDFERFTKNEFAQLLRNDQGTVIDVKGVFRGKTGDLDYWSL